MLIDMGQFLFQDVPGSHLLIQVAVPGLEDRSRMFPPLKGICMSNGDRAFLPTLKCL